MPGRIWPCRVDAVFSRSYRPSELSRSKVRRPATVRPSVAELLLRPRLQAMPEIRRAVTSASGREYEASPQSMRTLMPEGGTMALPVTTQSKSRDAVSPLASVTVMVTVKLPGVTSRPRMRRPTAPVSGGRPVKA